MTIAIVILSILTSIYVFQISRYYIGLFRLKTGNNRIHYSISIIVPARNEARHIADCLATLTAQNYHSDRFEIIAVDDHSQDETAAIVEQFATSHPNVKLIRLAREHDRLSPKKHALSEGIAASRNELIITTDADCKVHPEWLKTMVTHFEEEVGVVSGLVTFDPRKERTLFHKIQSLEFLSLIIAGAGSIGMDMPVIGNGANLAYRRSVFMDVDGFHGIGHLKSGDDDLFIQKVARLTTWKIVSSAERAAIVATAPQNTLRSFLNQRIRWASKGIHYHNPLFVLYLISVYLFYLLLFFSFPVAICPGVNILYPAIFLLLKAIADFILIEKGCRLTGRRDLLKYFPLTELFQIPYILIVGFAGLFGKYTWKGR